MKNTTIAVDLAKSVFEIAVSERPGKVSDRHRLSRAQFARFWANRESSVVLLEACGSAHFWGRRLLELGHQPVLLPPREVRPYVTRNKTDRSDAKALLEAHRNEAIRPVPIKTPKNRNDRRRKKTSLTNWKQGYNQNWLGLYYPLGQKQ